MELPILSSVQHWACPNCSAVDRTTEQQPHSRFHSCPGLNGLTAPMIPAGSGSRVRAVEREDYVGKENVLLDGNGRPIMAVLTERPDGSNDVAVLAPCATLNVNIS